MNKEYETNTELRNLAKKIIEEKNPNGLKESPAEFEFLLVYPQISKTTVGKCIKLRDEMQFITGLHYIIEMSGELWDNLSDKVKELVMEHELLHAMPVYNEKKGDWAFKIKNHNVRDFYQLLSEHGLDWFTELKTMASSVYDLKPEDEDKISL